MCGFNSHREYSYAAVAQLEEALVLETRCCGFKSLQQYCPGVAQLDSASVLGTEGRRFESCHSDLWVVSSIGRASGF